MNHGQSSTPVRPFTWSELNACPQPAGLRSPVANVVLLKERFDEVEATSGGEIAVQLYTLPDAMTLVHGVFGPGFNRYDPAPSLLTFAQMRLVAADTRKPK